MYIYLFQALSIYLSIYLSTNTLTYVCKLQHIWTLANNYQDSYTLHFILHVNLIFV